MNRALVSLFIALISLPSLAASNVTAPNVEVSYSGIDAPQAQSIADTLSAARQIYVEQYGFDMPDKIICDVKCAPGNPTRLYTDGEDHVYLSLSSKSQLDRPDKGNPHNLYGMCHELGHVAMYRPLKQRDWLSSAGAEGWAHWAGSFVIDRLYELKGESLWPDKYDYREDGTARLDRQLKAATVDDFGKAADQWRKLQIIVGPKHLPAVFKAFQDANLSSGDAKNALFTALASAADAQKKTELESWWTAAWPMLGDVGKSSDVKAITLDRAKLSGKPIKIELDDNTSDGMKSIAGGGHARRFDAPVEGNWYIVAVSVLGSRYGKPQNSSSFTLALCDGQNQTIASWTKPYAPFPYGKTGKWTRFEVPPTKVPSGFNICLDFKPTATNGVYVNYDASSKGHSRVATPGKEGDQLDDGDWMIRVELDQARDAAASGAMGQ